MDTVYKLSVYCREHGVDDIKIMGAPKTIDNDLGETDHCPGFGSAAKFIATAFTEIACDCYVYDIPSVTVVEVMGRNAGWLTASAALARNEARNVPQLIYLCERAFDIKCPLTQVDQLGHISRFISCEGRTGRQPSCIAPHDFHNRHRRNIIDIAVACNLCKSGGNEFGRRAKTRTMVCLSKIVVDGLRSSHDLDIIHSVFPTVHGKLIDGIHRIVSAGVNKISDIIFP